MTRLAICNRSKCCN